MRPREVAELPAGLARSRVCSPLGPRQVHEPVGTRLPAHLFQARPCPRLTSSTRSPHAPGASPGDECGPRNWLPRGVGGEGTAGEGEVQVPGAGAGPHDAAPECCRDKRGQEAQGPRELMLSPAEPGTSAEHCHVQR